MLGYVFVFVALLVAPHLVSFLFLGSLFRRFDYLKS